MVSLFASAAVPTRRRAGRAVRLKAGSRLWIEGGSSLHDWSCEAKKIDASVQVDPATPEMARGVAIHIPTADIDCGNGGMNSRLRDALKTPSIDFKLISAARLPGAGVKLKARGSLTIAGQTHIANLFIDGVVRPDNSIRATGDLRMKMTDFGVSPPSVLFMHTNDDITIKFDLSVSQHGTAHASL